MLPISRTCVLGLSMVLITLGQAPTRIAGTAPSPFEGVQQRPDFDPFVFKKRIADFEVPDTAGRVWRSNDLLNKITVVDIWATWCQPCLKEHPTLQAFYERTKLVSNLQLLTISLDDDPRRVRSYMTKRGYTFPVLVSDVTNKLFSLDGGIPKTFVVDGQARSSDAFQSWTLGRILIEVERFAKTR